MEENRLRKIIREELKKLLEDGIKVGTHSIYLYPDYIDMDDNPIRKIGSLSFDSSEDTNLYRSAANVLRTDDDFHIGGDLFIDGTMDFQSMVEGVVVSSSTINGYVTIATSSYSTIGISGNLITIGSTIPPISWTNVTGKPDFVNQVVSGSDTLTGSLVFNEGNNVTISVSNNTITFSAGTTEVGTYVDGLVTDGSTLQGYVTINTGSYSTIGVNGNAITIGNTVPIISWGSITGSPSFVNELVVGSDTLNGSITFVEGNNVTISTSGNSITISAGTTQLGTYVDGIIVDGSTINGYVTISTSNYTTIDITGNNITLGSTIPTITWDDVTSKPDIVNEVIIGSDTISNTITFVSGSNVTISVNGNSVTFDSTSGSLSGITIDTNKDWQSYAITNLSSIQSDSYIASTGSIGMTATVAVSGMTLIVHNGLIVNTIPTVYSAFPYVLPFEIA